MRIFDLLVHYFRCRSLRRWMAERWTPNLRSLYWRGMPLEAALSWSGFFQVLWWKLRSGEASEALEVLDTSTKSVAGSAPAPPRWHCQSLEGASGRTKQSLVGSELEAQAAVLVEEFQQVRERIQVDPDDGTRAPHERPLDRHLYRTHGGENCSMTAAYPKTAAILESLPLCLNFGVVKFSEFPPGPHTDLITTKSNLALRHHLPLSVPDGGHAALVVAGEKHHWRMGECLAFDPSQPHFVTDAGEVAILVVDTWHAGLTPAERETLSHPHFSSFGSSLTPQEFSSYSHELYRTCRLLRRHWNYFSFSRRRRDERRRQALRTLFLGTNEWLRKMGVEYWLDWGTLLGYFRDGDIIPGDLDVDFAMLGQEYNRVLAHRDELPPGFTLRDTSFKYGYPKLYVTYDDWEADLYFYRPERDEIRCPSTLDFPSDIKALPRDQVFPTQATEFLGVPTYVPQATEGYLRARFGYIGHNAIQDPETGYYHPRDPVID